MARMTEAQRRQHWIEESLDRLHADRALFALAEMLMKEWCDLFGGLPANAGEILALRGSFECAATKLLNNLLSMPDEDRRAVANRLLKSAGRRALAEAEGE